MYVGRLAPSPTGYLHLGHAATFLAAGDRARAAGGTLLLRIDDLDSQRSKPVYIAAIKEDLSWLGLRWEAEAQQSKRIALYRQAVEQLLRLGTIYPCSCSRKDLAQAVQAPHEDVDEPVYNGRCRPSAISSPANTFQPALNYRFRVPDGNRVQFDDGNFGSQSYLTGKDFGDFLVWRKDGLPSYQLATVVDDAAMGITEVVRGQDLLRSTARQLLLGYALNLHMPGYFHTELLHDAHGERLAKRHDALSLRTLRGQGMTPAEICTLIETSLHHNR